METCGVPAHLDHELGRFGLLDRLGQDFSLAKEAGLTLDEVQGSDYATKADRAAQGGLGSQ